MNLLFAIEDLVSIELYIRKPIFILNKQKLAEQKASRKTNINTWSPGLRGKNAKHIGAFLYVEDYMHNN